jgi:hypothetical protein
MPAWASPNVAAAVMFRRSSGHREFVAGLPETTGWTPAPPGRENRREMAIWLTLPVVKTYEPNKRAISSDARSATIYRDQKTAPGSPCWLHTTASNTANIEYTINEA